MPSTARAAIRRTRAEAAAARLRERASGLLLHVTSLPGPHGNGDIGGAAEFLAFMRASEQTLWQMLPVSPTGYGNSPYSATSAFAGNPLLIALAPLVERGWLARDLLERAPAFSDTSVDYAAADSFRTRCLRAAFERAQLGAAYERFYEDNRAWLPDFALFRAIKSRCGEVEWTRWPAELRDRQPAALARAAHELAPEIAFRCFEQWLFDEQWRQLHERALAHGVMLIGDMPIYLAHDSADLWQHRELFRLDAQGLPDVVAGVPPDYFSATGQRWGNPLYDWESARETGYRFFIDRTRKMLERFDIIRLDHFIGFERSWEIPASEESAVNGRYIPGPRAALFRALRRELGELPFIAEDLGAVTPEVEALRKRFRLPGMRILQFAFGTDPSAQDFRPHNYTRRSVVYTGTHDNDTTRGWFEGNDVAESRSPEQVEKERAAVLDYLGLSDAREIHWDMIRTCMSSVANTSIFPIQDVLGLGSEARMNRPGRAQGNWEWRMRADGALREAAPRLAHWTRLYERVPTAGRSEEHTGAES